MILQSLCKHRKFQRLHESLYSYLSKSFTGNQTNDTNLHDLDPERLGRVLHQLEHVAPLQSHERDDGPELDEEVADQVEAVEQIVLVGLPG